MMLLENMVNSSLFINNHAWKTSTNPERSSQAAT